MKRMAVLYDARCRLCRRLRQWLENQPKYVEITFIPAGSDLARRCFPQLDHAASLQEVAVIGDGGEVYWGAKAWLMCLWALQDYREWAFRLSTPTLLPMARTFVAAVSRHRYVFGVTEHWEQELDWEVCDIGEAPLDS